jgi:hypothetical protein
MTVETVSSNLIIMRCCDALGLRILVVVVYILSYEAWALSHDVEANLPCSFVRRIRFMSYNIRRLVFKKYSQ